MATSHELGQNFAKAFDIDYLSADGKQELAWTTSWGSTTRLVGGLIMAHGDDDGLRVPPVLAPIQVVVLAVKDEAVEGVHRLAMDLRAAGLRVRVDDQTGVPFGRRAVDWELKGVPLRVELGPRDIGAGQATVADRLFGGKQPVALNGLVETVVKRLAEAQPRMLAEATAARDARIAEVTTVEEVVEAASGGWAKISWSVVGEEGEARLAESAVSVRCLQREDGSVPEHDTEPGLIAYCGRSY
jgi:prolyl-tRNA synthetase